jgi:hypothetical protein
MITALTYLIKRTSHYKKESNRSLVPTTKPNSSVKSVSIQHLDLVYNKRSNVVKTSYFPHRKSLESQVRPVPIRKYTYFCCLSQKITVYQLGIFRTGRFWIRKIGSEKIGSEKSGLFKSNLGNPGLFGSDLEKSGLCVSNLFLLELTIGVLGISNTM